MKSIFLLFTLLLPLASHALTPPAPAPQTSAAPILAAKSYVLYDYTSNQVLVNQNGDARMEPASLTKLMTAYLAFDALKHGTLELEQKLSVPAAAARNISGESRMLLKAGQSVTVNELLHGLIVQSGNDAAITLAVNIAGSEAGFVELMNKEAKRLGMNNTHFANPVGLPAAQHYSSAYDLVLALSGAEAKGV
ncbi:MAG: serine hydrolase, partial [Gallionella sp.]